MLGQVATFAVDHIVPRTDNGRTVSSNLALACPHCNAHKWAFREAADPDSGQMVALFHPRNQDWSEHFAWLPENRFVLVGLTPCGRATVERLQMSSSSLQAIRRLLIELNLWENIGTKTIAGARMLRTPIRSRWLPDAAFLPADHYLFVT
jgi:hypothetical protein